MPDITTFWFVTLLMGIITYLIRCSFLSLIPPKQLPKALIIALKYIPCSVLAALAIPAVFLCTRAGTVTTTEPQKWVAALCAIVVAGWSKNVLLTLVSGLLCLWGMNFLIGLAGT